MPSLHLQHLFQHVLLPAGVPGESSLSTTPHHTPLPHCESFDSHPTDLFVTSSLTMCKSACLFLIYLPPSDFTSQLVSWAPPSGDPAVITRLSCYNQALSCSPSPKPSVMPALSPLPVGPERQLIFLMDLAFLSGRPAGTKAQLMLYKVIPPPCSSSGETHGLRPRCCVSWFPPTQSIPCLSVTHCLDRSEVGQTFSVFLPKTC